jgi:hypothetical protein
MDVSAPSRPATTIVAEYIVLLPDSRSFCNQ